MAAINGSTRFQPDDARAVRERAINGLYEPIREVFMAADQLHRAIEAHDLRRVEETDARLQLRMGEYLERMSG